MKRWTMRILGGLNILYFAAGIYYTVVMLLPHRHHWSQPPSSNYWFFFFLFFIFNFALVALWAYFGVRLIRGHDEAILFTASVLLAECISFWLSTAVFWNALPKYYPLFDSSSDLLAPQIITLYPVIGLAVTLVLAIRNHREPARLKSV